MQNWDTMQTTANYVEHNAWYNNMFAANIKTEPGTISPPPQQHSPTPSSASSTTHLENYLKQQQHHQQQQQYTAMDTNMTTANQMIPSPSNTHNSAEQQQQFFDTAGMHQQLMQQQQYQQHFQQAQQAAAQNQVTSHLPLGFNPLTPPGLPSAVIPAMSHFYTQSTQQQQQQRSQQQTPSPLPITLNDASEKSALTPRHTPPMDITPPKSPKVSLSDSLQMDKQDQELMSNSSEDLKYIVDSDDEHENIRLPIYNSHGKMKNYKCKSCGMVAITKLAFWDHAKTHMKAEKILQCTKCPFVTELKHHLEYHIRKHKNLKPFQCDKCSYSCVNKSMLNSHRKSHSSVYQYRCSDCDYATKYCHSFKLHLRKYDHKPGMVLDEEGIPNPSVVIDVYGTRRGPKNKGSGSGSLKKSHNDLKMPPTSQLSAALQGFPMNNGHQQMPASPAKSSCSVASELPALTLNMSLQNQQHHQQQQQQQSSAAQISPSQHSPTSSSANGQTGNLPNLLPPLASLLQQNHNMAFFPYWNLNLQMLAAQQQAAVLAQLSPRMREQLQQQQQEQQQQQQQDMNNLEDHEEDDDNNDDEFDRKSVDSAMDLSQGTPTKEDNQQTPELAMNLKLLTEEQIETPLYSSSSASRRKGRVLKLDQEQMKSINLTSSAPTSPLAQALQSEMPKASSPISTSHLQPPQAKLDDHSSADESMETAPVNNPTNNANTSSTSTASSSGNSSNSSSTSTNSTNSAASSPAPSSSTNNTATNNSSPTMYECKYCDIYFKDAVLYTIHMGYHSCDDVFKCNMCGEKCDGPVGLFVHMARNAHS